MRQLCAMRANVAVRAAPPPVTGRMGRLLACFLAIFGLHALSSLVLKSNLLPESTVEAAQARTAFVRERASYTVNWAATAAIEAWDQV